ncbi:MAG: ATP-binding cassette domain-containing protein, partial [Chloroflexi bacterium]
INLTVHAGERIGIVGPNGAGKTTFVNIVTGYIKPTQGSVLYLDTDLTQLSPRQIAQMGITRSFQIPQLYTSLRLVENVMLALASRQRASLDFWNPLRQKAWESEALEILEGFGLRQYADQPVNILPEGGRKLADIALAFALKPRLLFLDEPTSGVSMHDKFGVMDTLIETLERSGVTTIFIEHDMDVVYRYAERVLVFNEGRIVADGDPQSLFADAEIRRAVIGWSYKQPEG